jgi:hypothetical protein
VRGVDGVVGGGGVVGDGVVGGGQGSCGRVHVRVFVRTRVMAILEYVRRTYVHACVHVACTITRASVHRWRCGRGAAAESSERQVRWLTTRVGNAPATHYCGTCVSFRRTTF